MITYTDTEVQITTEVLVRILCDRCGRELYSTKRPVKISPMDPTKTEIDAASLRFRASFSYVSPLFPDALNEDEWCLCANCRWEVKNLIEGDIRLFRDRQGPSYAYWIFNIIDRSWLGRLIIKILDRWKNNRD